MKTSIISIVMALSLVLALVSGVVPSAVATDTFTPVTGWDMMAKLGAGITFANTTEARTWPWVSEWKTDDTETCWGQPKIEQWHFQSVALKGFDSYRMCVSWTPHMDENYKIEPAWMDRIQQIVDWALDAGLNVVLNTHHEEELYWLIRDGEYEKAKKHLNAIWSQLAERFKDYPESLIFELMNEPNLLEHYGGNGEWVTENGQISLELCETVNKLNFDALDTIRHSGGYNDKRVVVLCLPGAQALTILYMSIPDDPYIMFGAFGYEPGFFNNEIKALIQEMLDKGIGFVNKEDNVAADLTGHYQRLSDMGVPSFWFTGSSSIADEKDAIINRFTGEWTNAPFTEAILGAYGKTPGADLKPQKNLLFPYELEGPFHDKQYDYWILPDTMMQSAEKLVIEITGSISWYKVSLSGPSPFAEYEKGHGRFTQEADKIIFDLQGVESVKIGFMTWNDGDASKIKRIYLDGASNAPAPWAEKAVNSAIDSDIVPLSLQARYTQTITRAEYCALTVALYEKITGKAITERKNFPDDNGDVNIQKLYGLGIVGGSGGLFNPDGEFSRAEVAVMTAKLLEKLEKPLPAADSTFADRESIPAWALPAVGQVQAAGLMSGVGGNRFGPAVKYDRQSAIMLSKVLFDQYR